MASIPPSVTSTTSFSFQAIGEDRQDVKLKDIFLIWKRKGLIGDVDATGSGDSCGIFDPDGIGTVDDYGCKVYFAPDNTVWRSKEKGVKFNRKMGKS